MDLKIIEGKDLTLEEEYDIINNNIGCYPINPKKEYLQRMLVFKNPHLGRKWVTLSIKTKYNEVYSLVYEVMYGKNKIIHQRRC